MFAGGTQKKFWLFSGESEINKLRAEANGRYIKEYGKGKSVSFSSLIICLLQIRVRMVKLFSLFLIKDICCGYSKEPSR